MVINQSHYGGKVSQSTEETDSQSEPKINSKNQILQTIIKIEVYKNHNIL